MNRKSEKEDDKVVSVILWFLILSAGSVYGAAMWKKRYEEMLPITCSAIVFLLFVCGIAGNLRVGAVITAVLAVMMYLLTVIHLMKTKDIQDFKKYFISSGG